jgi:hypothetical protein
LVGAHFLGDGYQKLESLNLKDVSDISTEALRFAAINVASSSSSSLSSIHSFSENLSIFPGVARDA